MTVLRLLLIPFCLSAAASLPAQEEAKPAAPLVRPAAPATRAVGATPMVRPAGREQVGGGPAFVALREEYDAAYTDWRRQVTAIAEQGGGDYPESPDAGFYGRFRALAGDGEAYAALWCLQRLEHDPVPEPYRADRWRGEVFALITDHADDPQLMTGLVRTAMRGTRLVGEAQTVGLLRYLEGTTRNDDVVRGAMNMRASLLGRSRDAGRRAESGRVYAAMIERWPDSAEAKRAKGKIFAKNNLAVGQTAPDFVGVNVDGEELRLSDHRGKVVLIDFWGFW